jgi:hypothetical protein
MELHEIVIPEKEFTILSCEHPEYKGPHPSSYPIYCRPHSWGIDWRYIENGSSFFKAAWCDILLANFLFRKDEFPFTWTSLIGPFEICSVVRDEDTQRHLFKTGGSFLFEEEIEQLAPFAWAQFGGSNGDR